jgi:hypothetical protein
MFSRYQVNLLEMVKTRMWISNLSSFPSPQLNLSAIEYLQVKLPLSQIQEKVINGRARLLQKLHPRPLPFTSFSHRIHSQQESNPAIRHQTRAILAHPQDPYDPLRLSIRLNYILLN